MATNATRSRILCPGVFEDEAFENLVAALVTGTVIEGFMWLGIQFGFGPKGKKTIPLSRLISEGYERRLLDKDLGELLVAFGEIRNNFAHDPDYQLTATGVAALRSLLPANNEAQVAKGCANIFPAAPNDVVAVLVYEQIASLTYEAVFEAHGRKYEQPPDLEPAKIHAPEVGDADAE